MGIIDLIVSGGAACMVRAAKLSAFSVFSPDFLRYVLKVSLLQKRQYSIRFCPWSHSNEPLVELIFQDMF
jgi:hypothetical protein